MASLPRSPGCPRLPARSNGSGVALLVPGVRPSPPNKLRKRHYGMLETTTTTSRRHLRMRCSTAARCPTPVLRSEPLPNGSKFLSCYSPRLVPCRLRVGEGVEYRNWLLWEFVRGLAILSCYRRFSLGPGCTIWAIRQGIYSSPGGAPASHRKHHHTPRCCRPAC